MVKLEDIRPGRILYHVHAFVGGYLKGWVKQIKVTSLPYESEHTKSLFADCVYDGKMHGPINTSFSLQDANVVPNHYNMHRLFHTGKAAQRYLDRIQAGKLTVEECDRLTSDWY